MSWHVAISSRNYEDSPEPVQYLLDHGCTLTRLNRDGVWADSVLAGDSLVAALDGVDAIIGGPRITADVAARLPALKHVSRRGIGVDMIDVPAVTDAGIVVTITPNTTEDGVADHAWALMLAAARGVARADTGLRAGIWKALTGTEVFGKRLGVIGMGRIGRKVAQRARGFDMEVLAFDKNPREDPDLDVRFCSLPELLEQADFISVNVDLNAETRGLVGPAEFGRMKPTAVLVNTSRGPVIDEAALYDALAAGRIAAAGIDTFEREREHETRLIDLPNAVLTPHMGGHTVEGQLRANMRAARNVVGVREGRLDHETDVVNPDAWRRRLADEGRFAEAVVPHPAS